MRRATFLIAAFALFALILTACQPETVEVTRVVTETQEVEVTRVVTETITETIEVEGEMVEVTRVVEVEVPGQGGQTITFWSTETQPARAEATQAIIARFEEQTGINVELVLTDENALPNLMTAAVAAGTLPDVVFHPIDFTLGWYEQGILDAAAAQGVIDTLGADTFAQGPIDLVSVDGSAAAVPTDGWGQLIIYRADLFEAAGLEPPTSYDNIMTAAMTLHDPSNDFFGITAATAGGEVFTQQTFEHIALANNCQLVNDAGEVTLDTPECIEAVQFFDELMSNYSPAGVQDVVSTRATYFAGQAGMIVWSPFILDEMAGLRDNAFPVCPECGDNPAYLAENSGIVPAFSGPSGEAAQYGQISYMGITTNADVDAAQQFVQFWLSDGYLDWLAVAPEGKFPMRQGNADDATAYIDGWKTLETGVDRRSALGDIYSDEVINTLIQGAGSFNRWGFPQGQGPLVSAVYESLPVPRLLRDALDDTLDAAAAVEEMQFEVEDLQSGLEE